MTENEKSTSERLKELAQEFGVTVDFLLMALNYTPSSVQQRFVPPAFEGPTTSQQVRDEQFETRVENGGEWVSDKQREEIRRAVQKATTRPEQGTTPKPHHDQPTPQAHRARALSKPSHSRGPQRGGR